MRSSSSRCPGAPAAARRASAAKASHVMPGCSAKHVAQKDFPHSGQRTESTPRDAKKLMHSAVGHWRSISPPLLGGRQYCARAARKRSQRGVAAVAPWTCAAVTSAPHPGIGQQRSSAHTRLSRILTFRKSPKQPSQKRWEQSSCTELSNSAVSRHSGHLKLALATLSAISASYSCWSIWARRSSALGARWEPGVGAFPAASTHNASCPIAMIETRPRVADRARLSPLRLRDAWPALSLAPS
mmetsp:Transcript_118420/g.334765  ORF Transcript_118420/g.334765 Transcript_118420/m.334765 type:complete len:242 (+) Transcript_118420:423-1148(+)